VCKIEQVIKTEPLHMQAYTIIKSLLLEGEFHPGERLVEVKLAERLGVSRGPIREAFRMLMQDGLIVQNGGPIQVYQPTRKDLEEVFQCRESLEVLATQLAVKKMSTQQLDELVLIIEKTKEADQQKSFTELGKLDQAFHDLIIVGSENQQLIQLMSVIKTKVIYIRNTMIRNYYPNIHDIIGQHEQIYQALLERNEQKAELEMRSHIKNSLEAILKMNAR